MYFYNERYRVERMKTIHVSNETWRSLQELKLGKGYKTLDDVISYLLSNGREEEEE